MGLLNRLFGGRDKAAAVAEAHGSQFQESTLTDQPGTSRNAPRRELVQVMLRDTMRKHGIPSDWIDVRILTSVNKRHITGLHVQLIVKHGHENLCTYVYAFQESFLREIEKFDPRADEWLMSLAWQFLGDGKAARAMPDPTSWTGGPLPASAPVPLSINGMPEDAELHDEDLESDLKALYAIRDAALKEPDGDDPRDFQPTRPGFEESGKPNS